MDRVADVTPEMFLKNCIKSGTYVRTVFASVSHTLCQCCLYFIAFLIDPVSVSRTK